MKQNKFGELIFDQDDVFDLLMQGNNINSFNGMVVDDTVDLSQASSFIQALPDFKKPSNFDGTVQEWHHRNQQNWHMPDSYKMLDIAAHVLSLCNSEAELQRCGQELLLYQEKNLFDLLRYLKYLVDVMQNNNVVWGVGRGSSVASYVLFKIGVHRIDSLYYNLDIHEFLR